MSRPLFTIFFNLSTILVALFYPLLSNEAKKTNLRLASLLEFLPMPMHFSRWGANLEAARFRWQFGQMHSGCFFSAGGPEDVEMGWPNTSVCPLDFEALLLSSELLMNSVNWKIPVFTALKKIRELVRPWNKYIIFKHSNNNVYLAQLVEWQTAELEVPGFESRLGRIFLS